MINIARVGLYLLMFACLIKFLVQKAIPIILCILIGLFVFVSLYVYFFYGDMSISFVIKDIKENGVF